MSTQLKEVTQNFLNASLINGEWVQGSGGTFDVLSPETREVLHSVGRCSSEDVDQAVAAAKEAFPLWSGLSVIERANILRRVQELFVENGEAIAQMIAAEVAKPIMVSREEAYEYSAPSWGKAAEEILRYRGMLLPSTQEASNNKRLVLGHRPLGVIGVITPYNFPTDISSIALAHSAAAGNTVVWKPTEYCPAACAMVAELFAEAGMPPGVINLVQGLGDVGAAIVEHDGVDGIFFTGSTATGRQIATKCALKPHLLELGGDGPLIVLEDADIDAAVEGAIVGCFYYTGQVCTSAERLLVHEAVYDEFVEKLRKRMKELKVGPAANEDTDMGPLCNEATLKRVKSHVEDAVNKGAKIVDQHGKEENLYYPATILTDVTKDMLIMKEETFGPAVPILKIKSAEEALAIANESDLGLTASLWTQDYARAWRIAEALPHGTVNVNETNNYWDQLAPFGGAKNSGVGRELSKWFLDNFTEAKLICFDLGGERVDRRAAGGW